MTCKISQALIAILILFPYSAHALVDYSEEIGFEPQNSGASSVRAPAPSSVPTQTITKSAPRKRGGSSVGIHTGLMYQSQNVELNDINGKVDQVSFEAHFQTTYNLFLDATFYQAKSSDASLISDDTGFQNGNPKVILGFNWLQIGRPAEMATIDLYGGMSFGQKDSDFATTRNDQIVGISTAKRFYELALGLGYEYQMTGNPDDQSGELGLGNISVLSASLGWVVSSDIRFLVEGKSYRISAGRESNEVNEDVAFSTITPQMQLKLSPLINFNLGAKFRSRRIDNQLLLGARLWNLDGAYGNGVFAGLSVNL